MAKKPVPQQISPQRFDAFVVENYTAEGEERANWIRVGVAFPHDDGKGFQVQLRAVPVDGKLVLRLREAKPSTE